MKWQIKRLLLSPKVYADCKNMSQVLKVSCVVLSRSSSYFLRSDLFINQVRIVLTLMSVSNKLRNENVIRCSRCCFFYVCNIKKSQLISFIYRVFIDSSWMSWFSTNIKETKSRYKTDFVFTVLSLISKWPLWRGCKKLNVGYWVIGHH